MAEQWCMRLPGDVLVGSGDACSIGHRIAAGDFRPIKCLKGLVSEVLFSFGIN